MAQYLRLDSWRFQTTVRRGFGGGVEVVEHLEERLEFVGGNLNGSFCFVEAPTIGDFEEELLASQVLRQGEEG